MRLLYTVLSYFFLSLSAYAHEEHTAPSSSSLAISVAFDNSGALWRVRKDDAFVVVDKSTDLGKSFSKAVKVNPAAQKIAAAGEARPKISLSPEGNIYLTWTEPLKAPFAGYIWFARSIDGGKSFEKPYIVHQDHAETTHRFDALQVANNGTITVTWVDKRDLIAAKAAGKPYDGAAIYYAASNNKGKSFKPEQKLADSTCECCRIVTASKPDGTVVALWRHVFEGSERDHMIAEIPKEDGQTPVLKRASYGHWKIDGCPHHGAAIASGSDGATPNKEGAWWGYHLAYFDGNEQKPGLYYSRVDGEAWAFSPPKKFGNHAKRAAHPALLSMGDKVWLVWGEAEGKQQQIMGQFSDDSGRSWQTAKVIAHTSDKVDYPQLLAHQNQAYLVWNTVKEGLRVLPLQTD